MSLAKSPRMKLESAPLSMVPELVNTAPPSLVINPGPSLWSVLPVRFGGSFDPDGAATRLVCDTQRHHIRGPESAVGFTDRSLIPTGTLLNNTRLSRGTNMENSLLLD